jgi:hypothetical protein
MLGRRLLLLAALLLAVGAIAAALTPRDLSGPSKTTATTPTTSTTPKQATGGTGGTAAVAHEVTQTVDSDGPEEAVVRAREGDLLHLTVKVPSPDVVELAGLGRFESADASTPAKFDFFLDQAGQFQIRLQEAGRQVGQLLVTAEPA